MVGSELQRLNPQTPGAAPGWGRRVPRSDQGHAASPARVMWGRTLCIHTNSFKAAPAQLGGSSPSTGTAPSPPAGLRADVGSVPNAQALGTGRESSPLPSLLAPSCSLQPKNFTPPTLSPPRTISKGTRGRQQKEETGSVVQLFVPSAGKRRRGGS